MLKKHIVLFESKEYEWIAFSTIGSDAKRKLLVNKNYNIFYVFECDLKKDYPYTMKLKAPLNKYYDCKKINKYKEENFTDDDKYMIITSSDDKSTCFDIKHN
jgi:hypothetical protein